MQTGFYDELVAENRQESLPVFIIKRGKKYEIYGEGSIPVHRLFARHDRRETGNDLITVLIGADRL